MFLLFRATGPLPTSPAGFWTEVASSVQSIWRHKVRKVGLSLENPETFVLALALLFAHPQVPSQVPSASVSSSNRKREASTSPCSKCFHEPGVRMLQKGSLYSACQLNHCLPPLPTGRCVFSSVLRYFKWQLLIEAPPMRSMVKSTPGLW